MRWPGGAATPPEPARVSELPTQRKPYHGLIIPFSPTLGKSMIQVLCCYVIVLCRGYYRPLQHDFCFLAASPSPSTPANAGGGADNRSLTRRREKHYYPDIQDQSLHARYRACGLLRYCIRHSIRIFIRTERGLRSPETNISRKLYRSDVTAYSRHRSITTNNNLIL